LLVIEALADHSPAWEDAENAHTRAAGKAIAEILRELSLFMVVPRDVIKI